MNRASGQTREQTFVPRNVATTRLDFKWPSVIDTCNIKKYLHYVYFLEDLQWFIFRAMHFGKTKKILMAYLQLQLRCHLEDPSFGVALSHTRRLRQSS